ncbi:M48 family metallopeptidase [Solimonas soli]|uniref:M48 family metallopeptidase n=1 Tax=Solimonas soli TaxID=413479 RepID=UPI000481FC87|nr:M48 family metallopeptidase [Solimonas soli]
MTRNEFDALVARLERAQQQNPAAYRRRVLLLAFAGYAYLGAVLLALFALLVLAALSVLFLKALAVKLIIPLAAFIWLVLRAVWVKFDAPPGIPLRRSEVPQLYAMLDRLSARLRAPRFHHVLLVDEMNAAVVQLPRLGPFGGHRNYLLLGLPLMQSLTTRQFEAVLAHEFGHLAGGHARVGNWIYRLRMSWQRLGHALRHSSGAGGVLFGPFLNRYLPYFEAYSFPLARANEYEADAVAARLVSPQAAAQALTNVEISARYFGSRFWAGVHAKANDLPQPSLTPYAQFGASLQRELDMASSSDWLQQALRQRTTSDNTHPALADRLRALGCEAEFALPAQGEGAEQLLGDAATRLAAQLDEGWREAVADAWQRRHAQAQQEQQRHGELCASESQGAELTVAEARELAALEETWGAGAARALERFRILRERAPHDVVTAYELGRRLLRIGDAGGVALIEEAMAAESDAVVPGCELLIEHFLAIGDEARARAAQERRLQQQGVLAAARAERETVRLSDAFIPHELEAAVRAGLREQLQALRGLRAAWLIRKQVRHLPERPCYVLGFTITPWWSWHSRKRGLAMQKRIVESVAFPGETFVLCAQGDNRRFASKLKRVRDSRLL